MPAVRFLFVDDGSSDGTREVLARLQRRAEDRLQLLALNTNRGKGEAVRLGVLEAFASNADVVAYWDADLATPLEALSDFAAVLDSRPDIDIVLGSRVRLLGRDIERNALRHYFGRVFATAASLALGLPVYDTQCGAKVFRARTRGLFERPFATRWVFDVELLSRCMMHEKPDGTPEFTICEMPHLASHYGLTWYAAIPATLLVPLHFRRRGLFVALSFWLPFLFISIVVATKHYRYIFQLLPLLWLTLGGAAQVIVERFRTVGESWQSRRLRWSNGVFAGAALVLVLAAGAGFGRALATSVRRPWQSTGTFTTGYFYDWRGLGRDLTPLLASDAHVVSDMSYSTIYYLRRPSLQLIGSHRQLGVGDWENPDPDESRYVLDIDQLIPARSRRPVWIIATSGRWRQGFFQPSLTKYVETNCARVPTTATFVVAFSGPRSPGQHGSEVVER